MSIGQFVRRAFLAVLEIDQRGERRLGHFLVGFRSVLHLNPHGSSLDPPDVPIVFKKWADVFRPRDVAQIHIVAVKNLGGADRLFGGTMLAWLDDAGASYAMIKARASGMVTRHIEAMDFLAPGRLGDVLGIYGRVSKTGRTSISVALR